MARSLPWIGVVIGAATVISAMRRKGVISGALDTGINAVPFVGMTKNAVEVMRGRDFFPDRLAADRLAADRLAADRYGPGQTPLPAGDGVSRRQ